jgi:large subunit ribosomal protein L20
MPRVRAGVTRRHRHQKVLNQTKGFYGSNSRLYKRAHEALLHAGQYAFIGRKLRKRDMRSLWIVRINAALRQIDENFSYSKFIKQLKDSNVQLDRKVLADLAARNIAAFTAVVKAVSK